jgi:hypothetical protein
VRERRCFKFVRNKHKVFLEAEAAGSSDEPSNDGVFAEVNNKGNVSPPAAVDAAAPLVAPFAAVTSEG